MVHGHFRCQCQVLEYQSQYLFFFKDCYLFLLWNSLGPFATAFSTHHYTIVKVVDHHNASVPQFLLVFIVKFDSCYF